MINRQFLNLIVFFLMSCFASAQIDAFSFEPWNKDQFPVIISANQSSRLHFDSLQHDKRLFGLMHAASVGLKADESFKERKEWCHKHKLSFGSYHVGTNEDVSKQVETYLKQIGKSKAPMALVIERAGAGVSMRIELAEQFIKYVYKKTRRYPWLSIDSRVFQEISAKYDSNSVFAKCPLWYVLYVPKLLPMETQVWSGVSVWLFSSAVNCKETGACKYNVPGTRSDIGVSVFHGDSAALEVFWRK